MELPSLSAPAAQASRPPLAFRTEHFVQSTAALLLPIGKEAASCTACALSGSRTTVVFGAGTARSGIVLIGEAPGATEDAAGVPFVGRSGQLLDRMLAASGIARQDVYIANVLKCRPPGNRDPHPSEVAACSHFLRAQVRALRPRVICALGLHAARWLFSAKVPLSRLRGRILDYEGISAVVTYHPAALLRSPGLRPKADEDFALLRAAAQEAAAREV
jgi:DNA polymerase